MIGLVLALFSSFFFAANNTFARKGMYLSEESFSPVVISLFQGTILFGIALPFLGGSGQLTTLSWLGVSALAGAGIIHFLVGRMLGYVGVRFLGANRAVPIQTTYVLLAAILGVVFLGEPWNISLLFALLLIGGGIVLLGTKKSARVEKAGRQGGPLALGLLASLGAAVCWSISPLLVKIGLEEVGSPLLATFISYAFASIVIGFSLFHPGNYEKVRHLERAALVPMLISGFAVAMAQILRYLALDLSSISLAVPLLATKSLFLFPLSFLVNRKIEAFNLRVIMGAIAIVGGASLLFWLA